MMSVWICYANRVHEISGHPTNFILAEMGYARGLQCQTQYYRVHGVEYERLGVENEPLML